MISFLQDIAKAVHRDHQPVEGLTIVFPNRRAILYFRKFLSEEIKSPVFSPRLVTIEDFISTFSEWQVPDKMELIHHLYHAYHEVVPGDEPFDQFYFWGEMLLRDFEEIDKYRIDAAYLFKNLSDQKEIESIFEYFSEEQIEFLKNFWTSFDGRTSQNKERFLEVWQNLFKIYEVFRERLEAVGLAYEGMLYRDVAGRLVKGNLPIDPSLRVLFVGFNALTTTEKDVITYFVDKHSAKAYWDVDDYYLNNHNQEAGTFFRSHQLDPVLGKTFSADVPSHFLGTKKEISLYGAPNPVGQVKLMAQILDDAVKAGMNPEETLVVIPDEKMLLPTLHSLAACTESFNVTMGFPLRNTPAFNLIEILIDLQIYLRNNKFNHRQVTALLSHPYVVAADPKASQDKIKRIKKENRVTLTEQWLQEGPDVYRMMFRPAGESSAAMIRYLREVIMGIASVEGLSDFDKEYAYFFVKFLNRMEGILSGVTKSDQKRNPEPGNSVNISKEAPASHRSFLRLFQQLIRSERIPFSGEPLRGLQVMGVLETRNLDFKNVFILSLNEGLFPSGGHQSSYVPYSLRKAFGLPTVEHQDAIYGYLFYRIIQRAEHVSLFYNAEPDLLGQGEMSRYVRQLIYESGLPIKQQLLHNPVQPRAIHPITIIKDAGTRKDLGKYCEEPVHKNELTPSAINDYIDCGLRFYLRYIAGIREPREVEEELDARVLGILLHNVMEKFYRKILDEKKSNLIEASDLEKYSAGTEQIIDEVFIEQYSLAKDEKVVYEGQRLVVKEVVTRFVEQIIGMDKSYAPFHIEALEKKDLNFTVQLNDELGPRVVLGGRVDRADRKVAASPGGKDVLRVIDYKAGKDTADVKGTIADLFERDVDRNKAAFQVLFYAMLFRKRYRSKDIQVIAGLMNRVNLFDRNFEFGLTIGRKPIDDIDVYLEEFEGHLKKMLEEMFDPKGVFEQTTNLNACRICSFREICYR